MFDECGEIFEEMLFAEVVFCRISMFVDEEVDELWEFVSIGVSWMSEIFFVDLTYLENLDYLELEGGV